MDIVAQQKQLYAVYDLSVSPVNFDIIPYLVSAEIARIKEGADNIHFILIPPGEEGYYGQLGIDSESEFEWRIRQIILPSIALLPSVKNITVCGSRSQFFNLGITLDCLLYPENYLVEAPLAGFTFGEIEAAIYTQQQVPSLRAPERASEYVKRWIENHARGRLPVSITLREAQNAVSKNSKVKEWLKFISNVDSERYFIFLIRDTEQVFGVLDNLSYDVPQMIPASVNMEVRAAVYENCYLNLLGCNGPMSLCIGIKEARFLSFNLGVPGWVDTTPEAYRFNFGIEIGDQLKQTTQFQRFVWGEETCEIIEEYFELMTRFIEGGASALKSEREKTFFSTELGNIETFGERMFMARQWGPCKKIYRFLTHKFVDNGLNFHRLGVAETWQNQPKKGLELFKKALEKGYDGADLFLAKGEAHTFMGEIEQAIVSIQHAMNLDSNSFDGALRLGILFESQNQIEDARYWFNHALLIEPDSKDVQNLLSSLDQLN